MAQAQQREMVLLQEEPCGRAPSTGGYRWGMERGKSSPHPQKETRPEENLPPECVLRGIRVTLDNNSMWNEFYRCNTEMIVTKQGSRMFPYCRFRLSGLSPHKKYSLLMDLQPANGHRYRWGGCSWQVCGKAQSPITTPPFAHPDSPASGQHWMQSPVSFYRLKLTSDADDSSGNAVLHMNQLYLPHLHVVQTDRTKEVKLSGPGVITFTFPQTEFMAVSAYQNTRLTQLKVEYNPFSKGLKDDTAAKGLKQHCNEPGPEQNPLKKSLKSLLANHKPKSSKLAEPKGEPKEQQEVPKTSTNQLKTTSTDQPKSSFTELSKSCSKDESKYRPKDRSEPAAKGPTEQTCHTSRPSQKLFSERIREAHVALQRCNLTQYEVHSISSEQTPKNCMKDSEKEGTRAQNCTKNAEKVKKDCSISDKDDSRAEVSKENKPVTSTASKSESSSDVRVHKRPATLPLSALGLFLKQHSAKSKKTKVETENTKGSKPESQKTETRLEPSLSESKDISDSLTVAEGKGPKQELSIEKAVSHKPDHKLRLSSSSTKKQENFTLEFQNLEHNLSKEESDSLHQSKQESYATDIPKSEPMSTERLSECLSVILPETSKQVQSVPKVRKKPKSRKRSKWHKPKPKQPTQTSHSVLSLSESLLSKLTLSKNVFGDVPKTNQHLDSHLEEQMKETEPSQTDLCLASTSTVLRTSPPPFCVLPSISPPLATVLPGSAPLSSAPLPDPECARFGFEPLSPASSPEPLPNLPESLTLDLEPPEVPKNMTPDLEKDEGKMELSVFKWHTVLPPPEQCLAAPFSPFQPPVSPPALNSQSENSAPSLPPEASAFQEQSLPFPGELSPLALQFPVSPTFSSLDGDALSPTDLTELVHFFAGADADLGIGDDFSNATTEEQMPQVMEERSEERSEERPEENVELQAEKRADQKRPEHTPRGQRSRKRRRGAAKVELEPDSSYAVMKPSLEEVEEQLFVSFTSKEALELHIGDSPENSQTGPAPSAHTYPAPLCQTGSTPSTFSSKDTSGVPESLKQNRPDSPPEFSTTQEQNEETTERKQHKATGDREQNKESGERKRHEEPGRKLNKELGEPVHKTAAAQTRIYHEATANENANEEAIEDVITNRIYLEDAQNQELFRKNSYQEPAPENSHIQQISKEDTSLSLDKQISEFQQLLLRDVKLMKHKQVIHPVLQQVGLKMSLLDPSLPVDLQYLGIPLPLPPPQTNQEPSSVDAGGVSGAFVSRTGKTTDVTQIKGWRDKYSSDSVLSPEAAPVSEPKKNLSAFCSDMLDEYLEMEGKLIDERASSFTTHDPAPSPVTFDLPTHSKSYVRVLTSVLKANPVADSSTSDLISGFVPPSKRPKPPPNRAAKKTFKQRKKLTRKDENYKLTTNYEEQRGMQPGVQNVELVDARKLKTLREKRRLFKAGFGFDNEAQMIQQKKFGETDEALCLETENTADSYDYDFTEPLSHSPKLQKNQKHRSDSYAKESNSAFDSFSESSKWSEFDFDHTEPISEPPEFGLKQGRRRRRRRRRSEELELMAPLESDSELCNEETDQKPAIRSQSRQDKAKQREEEMETPNQKEQEPKQANQSWPLMTKALVKQRDLEQRGFWEGKQRTYITHERATVALSSLFTIKGFVAEDPRLPVRLAPRPAPRCLNDFCRLGCMCASLTHCARSTHCRRAHCMLRCTCLKQKVVLLRNLDNSDSPSPRYPAKKKKRRRRMKMAYVLKEAESVSQPASPVRTLWVRTRDQDQDLDLDPVCVPAASVLQWHTAEQASEEGQSCARIRSFSERKRRKQRPGSESVPAVLSEHLNKEPSDPTVTTEESRSCARIRAFTGRTPRKQQKTPESDKPSTPSGPAHSVPKRLVLLANCHWQSEGDRISVLKVLCEALALGSLERPFWIGPYFISPFSPTLVHKDGKPCTEIRVHISTPKAYMATAEKERREETRKEESREEETKEETKEETREEETREEETREEETREEETREEETREEETREEETREEETREEETREETPEAKSNSEKKKIGEEKEEQRNKETREERIEENEEEKPKACILEKDRREDKKMEERTEERREDEEIDWPQDEDQPELSEPEDQGVESKDKKAEHDDQEGCQEQGEEPGDRKASKPPEDLIEDRKQDVKFPSNQIVALPFLTSISPAGFMSASLKRGKDDNCVQVNGKLYPLAKVQLGRMGALHPANRLAAYLTGRVGGSSRPLSSASPLATASPLTSAPNTILPTSTASTTVGPNQSSARPKPESVAGSGSGSGSGPKPSVPTFPPGSQVNVRPPPPQVLMIQVPGPSSAPLQQIVPISSGSLATIPPFSLPLSALTSVAPIAPVTSTTLPLSTLTPAPSLPSGSTPFSSLTPVAPVASVSSTSLTFSTLTPAISFPSSSIPLTSLTPIAPVSSGSNPISSLMPVTPVAPVAPVSSGSLPLAQTRTVLVPQVGSPQTLQISGPALSGPALSGPALSGPGGRLFRTPDGRLVQLIPLPQKPTSSMIHNNKHMIIYRRMKNKRGEVTLVPVTGQSAASSPGTVNPASSSVSSFVSPKSGYSFKFFPEKSTKEKVVVRTSEVVPNPAHVLKILTKTSQNQPKTSEKQPKNTNQTRSEEEEEPRSVFKGAEEGQGVEEELAVDLNDLDVICVDGEDEQRREEQRREEENQDAVVIVDSSSEETENSSDYNSGDDETHQKKKDLGRKIHNLSEKIRRHEMDNLFQTLRKEVGLEDPLASRKLTLNKAQALIQDLRTTEKHLRSLKLRLRSSRDGLLNRLLPHTEEPAVQALLREHRRRKDSMVPREDDVIEVIDLQRAKPRRRRANQAEDGQMDVKVQRQLKTLITDQSSEVSLEEEQQNLQEELQSTNPTPAKTATSSPAKAPPHTVTSFPTNVPPLHAVTSSPTKTAASPSKVPVTKSSSPIKTMTSSPAKAPPPHAVTSSPVTLIITQNSTLRQRTVPNILSRRKTSASSAYSQKEGPQMQTVLPPRFVMTSSSLPAPMFQGQVLPRQQLVPAQVLPPRQVRPPCQQVVTLQPVLPSPAIATVALNLSNNQQLSSGHRLSPGDLITCSAPLPISNPGGELNLVHLVSPQKASTLPSPKPQLPSAPAATSAPPTVTQTPPTGPPPSKDPSPLVAGPTKITDPPPSPKSLSPQKATGQSQTLQLPSDSAPTAPTEQQFPSVPASTAPTELQLPSTLAPTAPTELHLPSATAQRKIKTILKHIPHPTSKKTFSKKETVQSPKLQLPSAPPPTETTDPPSCPLSAAPVQPQPSSPTVHQSEPTPQRSESAAFSLDNSQRHSSLIQSEPSLASLLSEIAFLNQNSKTSPNQSPGPALAPPPLVKLSSSSSISREKANHSSGGGAWRPMPKLRRL